MKAEIIYMLGIVAAGFATNYLLRALPFLLFARHKGPLPKGVEKLGNILSPVIIAGLVIYSFATLTAQDGSAAWKGFAPYLAGGLTVILHLWKRNALVSIIAGTILYMVLL